MHRLQFYIAIIGGFLILILLNIHQYNRTQEFKRQSEDREAIMNQKERDWKTKEGRLVHESSVVKLQSDKVAKEIFKQDSLLKDLGIKWNKVQSLSKTTIENHYHIVTPIINQGDSTYKLKQWTNNYLTVNGEIDLKKNIANLEYQHRDTLTQVIHYKRSKKFLKLIPYGKFEFKSQTTLADTSSRIVEQVTFIRDRK